jgi:hypothetical protein
VPLLALPPSLRLVLLFMPVLMPAPLLVAVLLLEALVPLRVLLMVLLRKQLREQVLELLLPLVAILLLESPLPLVLVVQLCVMQCLVKRTPHTVQSPHLMIPMPMLTVSWQGCFCSSCLRNGFFCLRQGDCVARRSVYRCIYTGQSRRW